MQEYLVSVKAKKKYNDSEKIFFIVKDNVDFTRFRTFINKNFDEGYFDLRTVKGLGWSNNKNLLRGKRDIVCLNDA